MSDRDIGIREAVAGDAVAIAQVHVQCWREAYAGIVAQETLDAMSVDDRSQRWARILETRLADPAFCVFVAEKDGAIVGFGSVASQRDTALAEQGYAGELTAIYLLAAHHGSGAAQRLIGAMVAHLIGAGIATASVWVLEDNLRARRFYEKMGGQFLRTERRERRDTTLSEAAYGWRDLTALL